MQHIQMADPGFFKGEGGEGGGGGGAGGGAKWNVIIIT